VDGRPDYVGYLAKDPEERAGVRKVPGKAYWRVKAKVAYGALSYPYGVFKHSQLLRKVDRTSTHTYTCFYRAPTQLQTLSGPVLDFLGRPERSGKRLEIVVMACSNGAEAYTIVSWLTQHVPDLDFHVTATDLHQSMADKAAAGEYTRDEALHSEYVTPEFVAHTFDRRGDLYVVKPALRAKASFSQADLLDGETLRERFEPASLVLAQNVLFHLSPDKARIAFDNLYKMLAPRAALLIEGTDGDLRVELTKQYGLEPLADNLRRIYSETRVHTPVAWWKYYWGSEPYFPLRPDKNRRYGTIFLKHG
jgi:chemotaxis protein methyltransferase CheR